MSVMRKSHGSEIISSDEMRDLEKSNFLKKDSYLFMKKAGYLASEFINSKLKKNQPVIILCGPGNNGGDGFIIAKHLRDKGHCTKVFTFLGENSYKGDALRAFKKFKGDTKNISFFKLKKML